MAPPGTIRTLVTAGRFLAFALVFGGIFVFLRMRAARIDAAVAELRGPVASRTEPCRPVPACGAQIYDDLPERPTVSRDQACTGAAYLCEGLALRGEPLRVLRWNENRPPLRILVTWPDDADRRLAARQQLGAVRGVRAWAGLPLDLRVDVQEQPPVPWSARDTTSRTTFTPVAPTRTRRSYAPPPQAEFEVDWRLAPNTSEMGEAYTRWGSGATGGGFGIRVTSVSLPRMTPTRDRDLTDREVEAAAAHAMGHVLGLPHSSNPADVMFPGNTARTPSADDLSALAALYALPNGAEIR